MNREEAFIPFTLTQTRPDHGYVMLVFLLLHGEFVSDSLVPQACYVTVKY
jgi:hypothetical protein